MPKHVLNSKRHETNTEFITRVMEFSKSGPLMQAFVIECLTKWSDHVVDMFDAEPELLDANNWFINPKAWYSCAKELQSELAKKCEM